MKSASLRRKCYARISYSSLAKKKKWKKYTTRRLMNKNATKKNCKKKRSIKKIRRTQAPQYSNIPCLFIYFSFLSNWRILPVFVSYQHFYGWNFLSTACWITSKKKKWNPMHLNRRSFYWFFFFFVCRLRRLLFTTTLSCTHFPIQLVFYSNNSETIVSQSIHTKRRRQ